MSLFANNQIVGGSVNDEGWGDFEWSNQASDFIGL